MAKLITLLLEPKHSVYDYLTKKRSLLVSRGHGKTTFTEEYLTGQTDLAIITPTPGRKLDIVGLLIATDSITADVSLDFVTSGKKVMRLYSSAFARMINDDMHIEGDVDEVLTFNSTAGNYKTFIMVNYRETVE